MADYNTAEEILDFAIEREEEAAQFYTELAASMEKPWMKKVFEDFAREEKGHKEKLIKIKSGERPMAAPKAVQNLKMADYLVDQPLDPEMDYQGALILAMKKEKAAFKLYMDLADNTEDAELEGILRMMAQEEAKHKLRFEIEYDENFMDSKY
jgi:rubrerythrin